MEVTSSGRIERTTERLCVLLVDDVEDNRDLYVQYLQFHGVCTHAAGTAVEGIATAAEVRPHVIVMDLGLPGMDGTQATRLLKHRPDTRNIPVVVLSAHVYATDRRRARQAGGIAFLAKPCDPSRLLDVIRRVRGGASVSPEA
jgi:two-component system, cell cycle response regulator DivK